MSPGFLLLQFESQCSPYGETWYSKMFETFFSILTIEWLEHSFLPSCFSHSLTCNVLALFIFFNVAFNQVCGNGPTGAFVFMLT
jgi:hypothetical protein